jgi:hypothetical protein
MLAFLSCCEPCVHAIELEEDFYECVYYGEMEKGCVVENGACEMQKCGDKIG